MNKVPNQIVVVVDRKFNVIVLEGTVILARRDESFDACFAPLFIKFDAPFVPSLVESICLLVVKRHHASETVGQSLL